MKLPGLKSALLAGVFAVASSAALAADLPMAPPPVVEEAPAFVPTYDWNGLYVGVVAGYGFGNEIEGEFWGPYDADDIDGFQIGGTVGYNYQINNFVLGVEGDISYWGVDEEDNIDGVEASYFGTLRARAGYSFGRFMVYGTGGLAFTDADFNDPGYDDDVKTGWTVGAGTEAFITPNLTAKLEYLYADFEEEDFWGDDVTLDAHVIRAGVNYKFNW